MRLSPCCLGTVCVPWHDDFSFAEDLFRQEVRYLLAAGMSNLYIFGTAGEGYAVTDEQCETIARVFFDEMRTSDGFSQLGVIGLSVPQVKARIEMGLAIGFRAFQISLPSWGAVSDREMYRFFDDVLGAYPQASFLHYNLRRGLRVVTAAEYARILADHPNLVATKSVATTMTENLALLDLVGELCHFFTELNYAFASQFGPCGLLASITAISAPKALALFAAGQRGDSQAIVELTRECYRALQALLQSLTPGERIDGGYDKLYAKMHIPDFPLCLLSPYQGATEEEFTAFAARLRESAPDWLNG